MDQEKESQEGVDLSGMLKDAGTGVKFESEQQYARSFYPETPKIIRLVIKYSSGYIKDEKQALYVILGFVGLFLVFTIILFSNVFSGPSEPPAGYRGNIPDLPEYRNPPTPQDFR